MVNTPDRLKVGNRAGSPSQRHSSGASSALCLRPDGWAGTLPAKGVDGCSVRPDSRDRALGCLELWPVPNVMKGLERSVRHTLANAVGHVGS